MVINVFPPKRGSLEQLGSTFALQQDNWNDYSFQTLYHLYYQPEGSTPATLIGPVKILRRGQAASDTIQIKQPFEQLSPDFCSVGNSLDYYQRLSEIPRSDRDTIVTALRDVVAAPGLRNEFNQEEGWRVSLFRENSDHDGFLADATAIFSNSYAALADLSGSLIFRPAGWTSPLILNFDAPEPLFYMGPRRPIGPSGTRVILPRRIIVVIGRNGSGKSTLLSRIARVAFASPSERTLDAVRAIGEFEPASIGFMRIIAISYSAFDNFILPGVFDSDLRQIAADVEKGSGRYVYAGLRDVVREARDDADAVDAKAAPMEDRQIVSIEDRRTTTKLKSLDQLADEFTRLVEQIDRQGDGPLLDAALAPLLADQSFIDLDGSTRVDLFGDNPRQAFMGWSTGHKIALHVLTSLVAHATRKAIVLFDEPESHLHPPLTAALMNAVRIVLEEKNAFAIVATHSPVVLQETLARHVRVVARIGDHFEISAPKMETFGENVGILTQGTFGLTSAATDFHHVLDLLIEGCDNLDEINQCFSPELSGQALAYVMAGLARKGKKS
ncbi:AAA family ATPase [Mesorhizobium retamae]|uniref:ATP-binding protein n=1 Tax=Mesorhizobium retamae TaxID=2912854 RepID=A0ABS9QEK1_9HYPH|nr:AAA family ATPase [Mesorhizobium sp. IRAMC:0171]MCG7505840.1 ATP-binding protein [Mesorhizobium sp. IRAMC:0171]